MAICRIKLVINYLIAVCLIAVWFCTGTDFSPHLKSFADVYFLQGIGSFMEDVKRLYGIGAAFRWAGVHL